MVPNYINKSLPAKHLYQLLCLPFLLFAVTPPSQAESVTLAWGPSNSAPVTYRLFQRTSGQSYDYRQWIYEGSESTYTIDNLAPDTMYYFVVRACQGDNQSGDSNEVSYTTQVPPSPDTGNNSGTDISIVIDNVDSRSYSTGTWRKSGGKNPYGGDSLYSRKSDAAYTFESFLRGPLDLSLWWTEFDNRCRSVPVHIYDGDLILDTVYINQLEDGGRWNFLGEYIFKDSAQIVIVSEGSACSTSADAAQFSTVTDDGGPISDPSSAPNPDSGSSGTDISIMIDNLDDESYATGPWRTSAGRKPYEGGSLYSRKAGAAYAFESTLTGALDVSMWWSRWNGRCRSVPVYIYDGDQLLDTVYVNQRKDGGRWNFLGGYLFRYSAQIVIVSESNACSTCADAVRFEQSR